MTAKLKAQGEALSNERSGRTLASFRLCYPSVMIEEKEETYKIPKKIIALSSMKERSDC